MKHIKHILKSIAAVVVLGAIYATMRCSAAQFTNLNFEAANVGSAQPGDFLPASTLIPGWSAFVDAAQVPVLYDAATLGASAVCLIRAGNPFLSNLVLSGQFSLTLISGFAPGGPGSPFISQTGLVPANTSSLRFIGSGDAGFQVLANGTSLPSVLLATTPAYGLYAVDISAYAGSEIELRLLLQHTSNFTGFAFDDITFSSEPVPEPSILALLAFAGLLGWFSHRRKAR